MQPRYEGGWGRLLRCKGQPKGIVLYRGITAEGATIYGATKDCGLPSEGYATKAEAIKALN
jgi:hypothetical protein